MDQPLVRYDGAGTGNKQSLHADERGSIAAASYGAPYAPLINRYGEFGKPQNTNIGRFQYTGQMWLPEAGLYHYKARAYAAHLGRFVQTDPIGYEDSANLYAYVGNDPVNFTDPLGLQPCGAVCPPPLHGDIEVFPPFGSGGGGGGTTGGSTGSMSGDPPQIPQRDEAPQPSSGRCRSPPITKAERDAAKKGDRGAFWASRLRQGDPLGAAGLTMVTNSSIAAQWANMHLRSKISSRSPSMGPMAISREVQQIGVQIMQRHMAAVTAFGSPTAGQIAGYHFEVFEAHGLPRTTFAGAFITGTSTEAGLSSGAWLHCR